jgi:hypothetical protein
VSRLHNEEQLRLRENLETAVKVGWCEMAASLGVSQLKQRVSCEAVAGQYGREHRS